VITDGRKRDFFPIPAQSVSLIGQGSDSCQKPVYRLVAIIVYAHFIIPDENLHQ